MRPRLPIAALLASVALGAGAAPALADSIAYIKDDDVWLATPDGSRQVQVTDGTPYSFVSQADDGTMIALAPGERLHRLARDGRVLADFATYVSDGAPTPGPVNRFHGPFEPQISPDGTKVAFEWFNDSYEDAPGCSEQTVPPCAVYRQRQGVGISSASAFTAPDAYGLLTGWIFPQWLDESTLVRSSSGTILNDDAVLTTLTGGGGHAVDPWMVDEGGLGVDDVELSRDRTAVAGVAGSSDEHLRIYRTTMEPSQAPDWNHSPFAQGNVPAIEACGQLSGDRFEGPSFSPDGRSLAYGASDGVHVMPVPAFAGSCTPPASVGTLVLPGARHADWGPADVPPATAPGAAPGPSTGPAAGPAAGRARLGVRRVRLGRALRRGLVVRVEGVPAGRVRLVARRGAAVVARGSARAGAAGRATVRLRFTASGKRRLGAGRRVSLRITGAGTAVTATLRR